MPAYVAQTDGAVAEADAGGEASLVPAFGSRNNAGTGAVVEKLNRFMMLPALASFEPWPIR